jgi:hypothetical protein
MGPKRGMRPCAKRDWIASKELTGVVSIIWESPIWDFVNYQA